MIIDGNQIMIRPIEEEDTDLIIQWRNKDFVRQNFIYQNDFTKEEHMSWYKNKVLTQEVYQFIIINKELDRPVGSIYLRDIDLINKKAEYGIFIGEEDSLGKGYGTEAGNLILKFAFETLKLHKVFLRVFNSNKGAVKSYQHIGFKEDGVFRDDVLLNDEYHDILFMSILRGEYYEKN